MAVLIIMKILYSLSKFMREVRKTTKQFHNSGTILQGIVKAVEVQPEFEKFKNISVTWCL